MSNNGQEYIDDFLVEVWQRFRTDELSGDLSASLTTFVHHSLPKIDRHDMIDECWYLEKLASFMQDNGFVANKRPS